MEGNLVVGFNFL